MLQIPVLTDAKGVVLPAFDVVVSLEGREYTLGFRWNIRGACWVLDIGDAAGAPILAGVRVRVRSFLNDFPGIVGLPPGRLIAVDSSNQDLDPGLTDLGARVLILYATASELT